MHKLYCSTDRFVRIRDGDAEEHASQTRVTGSRRSSHAMAKHMPKIAAELGLPWEKILEKAKAETMAKMPERRQAALKEAMAKMPGGDAYIAAAAVVVDVVALVAEGAEGPRAQKRRAQVPLVHRRRVHLRARLQVGAIVSGFFIVILNRRQHHRMHGNITLPRLRLAV